jgi:hypothetical protein
MLWWSQLSKDETLSAWMLSEDFCRLTIVFSADPEVMMEMEEDCQ